MSYLKNKLKRLWGLFGPGLTTGAADDDPSGIATYSQAGAHSGFGLLWLAPVSFVFMGVVQELCARIALVTGRGLAENIRRNYSKYWLYFCGGMVIFANTLNIGADLGGMASAVLMFTPNTGFSIPLILFVALTIYLEIFVSYKSYAKYLKWLAMTLVAYVITFMVIHIDLTELLRSTLVPVMVFDKESMFLIAAVLGTTISPYLFFWQTSQEIEDEISRGDYSISNRIKNGLSSLKQMRFDTWFGMLFSNVVMFAIIAVCASTLHSAGIFNINSASEAASALKPLAGDFAYLLFALGIISTGLLAIPVLAASSAYIFTETFRLKEGLYRKPKEAMVFYIIIGLSLIAGLGFNFLGINPIKALIYASIANAVVSPISLVFVMLLSNNKKIMGSHSAGFLSKLIGWGTVLVMTLVAAIVILQFI